MFQNHASSTYHKRAHVPVAHKVTALHRLFLLMVLVLTAIPAWKLFATLPHIIVTVDQVYPEEALPGDTVTLTGYALDAAHVQELQLTGEDRVSYKCEILQQSTTALQFRVPAKIQPGWMSIAIKPPGEPVYRLMNEILVRSSAQAQAPPADGSR